MPRADRAQQFLIDPLAVTRDPVRIAMSPAARGVYDTLWLESWNEKRPGWLPANEGRLQRLADVSEDTWESVRDEVATGFEVSAQWWICHAVERTKTDQDAWRTRWRKQKREQRKRAADSPPLSRTASCDGSGSGTGSGSGAGTGAAENQNLSSLAALADTPISSNGHQPKPTRARRLPLAVPQRIRPEHTDWDESFWASFWPAFLQLGRRCPKAEALKAWQRVPHARGPAGAADFNALMDAFDADVRSWRAEGREPRHIPHAATWINAYARDKLLEASDGA